MLRRTRTESLSYAALVATSILLRLIVGLHSYSGKGDAPQYGDYEAQRHWMELTTSLPVRDWYKNTNDNVLGYWGLDYPPLTAYQSWLCGKVIGFFEPAAVELHSSRGYETASSKLLMRLSVIAFDILVFIPGIFAAVWVFHGRASTQKRFGALAIALLQPAAILIDHGHFQYNNISLGLTAGAAAALGAGWELLGSCLFCLALNHKQMALYYAPAFFAHLLGRALQEKTLSGKAWHVAKLGVVVIATFAVVWAPYLHSWQSMTSVLHRLAPVNRGLFEDYVANFWCVSSLAIKWKRLASQQALLRITAATTLAGSLPAMLQQIKHPSATGLLYCMANTAFSFFMFSYQVHEKSILLPLLPVTLLRPDEPLLAVYLPAVASLAMFPLLKRDGLALAYAAMLLFWGGAILPDSEAKKIRSILTTPLAKLGMFLWVALGAAVHLLDAFSQPPRRFPFLHDALFVSLAFLPLFAAAVYLNLQQWNQKSKQNLKQKHT